MSYERARTPRGLCQKFCLDDLVRIDCTVITFWSFLYIYVYISKSQTTESNIVQSCYGQQDCRRSIEETKYKNNNQRLTAIKTLLVANISKNQDSTRIKGVVRWHDYGSRNQTGVRRWLYFTHKMIKYPTGNQTTINYGLLNSVRVIVRPQECSKCVKHRVSRICCIIVRILVITQ